MKKFKDIFLIEFGKKNKNTEPYSCCGDTAHSHHEKNSSTSGKFYQCPMKCEGDKIYNAPGNCPVCNMHLVPVCEKYPHH